MIFLIFILFLIVILVLLINELFPTPDIYNITKDGLKSSDKKLMIKDTVENKKYYEFEPSEEQKKEVENIIKKLNLENQIKKEKENSDRIFRKVNIDYPVDAFRLSLSLGLNRNETIFENFKIIVDKENRTIDIIKKKENNL